MSKFSRLFLAFAICFVGVSVGCSDANSVVTDPEDIPTEQEDADYEAEMDATDPIEQ